MMRRLLLTTALALILLPSCRQEGIAEAIRRQLQQYPESRVQDIYKNFCQDNLGPGHLIPDPDAARAYLLKELQSYGEDLDSGRYCKAEQRCIPLGDEGNYFRVDLSVVLDSLMSADDLLDAFVRSANEGRTLPPDKWKKKWKGIAAVIQKDFPDIPDAENDLAAIDSLVAQGHFILHHSRVFNDCYHPHYRVIARKVYRSSAASTALKYL